MADNSGEGAAPPVWRRPALWAAVLGVLLAMAVGSLATLVLVSDVPSGRQTAADGGKVTPSSTQAASPSPTATASASPEESLEVVQLSDGAAVWCGEVDNVAAVVTAADELGIAAAERISQNDFRLPEGTINEDGQEIRYDVEAKWDAVRAASRDSDLEPNYELPLGAGKAMIHMHDIGMLVNPIKFYEPRDWARACEAAFDAR